MSEAESPEKSADEDPEDESIDATDFMGGSVVPSSGKSGDDTDEVEDEDTPGLQHGEYRTKIREYLDDRKPDATERARNDDPDCTSISIDYEDVEDYNEDLAFNLTQSPEVFSDTVREYLDEEYTGFAVKIEGSDDLEWKIGESRQEADGSLVTVKASLVARSSRTSVAELMAFRCERCGTLNREPTRDDWSIKTPGECNACEREGPYTTSMGDSDWFDYLQVELEELPEEAVVEGSPEKIRAEAVRKDLVDEWVASSGARVEVTGVLKREKLVGEQNPKEVDDYLRITSVDVLDGDSVIGEMSTEDWEHIERARELAANDDDHDLLDVMAYSAHPTLRREAPMRGGLLSLAGAPGVNDKRGYIHMLLVGQPGEGKSMMHNRLMDVAPRSVAAHSGDTTKAGLTTAATRTSVGNGDVTDYIIRPGLLPRAHRGHLFFDELDGLERESQDAMLSPMSDGVVKASKGGKMGTFPTETAIIATSNPSQTTWMDDVPAAEQLPFNEALISRFDLVFPFFGDSTQKEDRELAEMILDEHTPDEDAGPEDRIEWLDEPVPKETIRRYIAHVRQNIDPVIPRGSDPRERIVSGWVELTNMDADSDQSIGPRIVEALIRLSKASARLRMAASVEMQDVETAFSLLNHSFKELDLWNNGSLDVSTLYQDPGQNETSQEKRRAAIEQTIQELEEDGTPTTEPRILEQMNLDVDPDVFEDEVEEMKRSGQLAVINENDGLEVL